MSPKRQAKLERQQQRKLERERSSIVRERGEAQRSIKGQERKESKFRRDCLNKETQYE